MYVREGPNKKGFTTTAIGSYTQIGHCENLIAIIPPAVGRGARH